jgi:hypothetical protein
MDLNGDNSDTDIQQVSESSFSASNSSFSSSFCCKTKRSSSSSSNSSSSSSRSRSSISKQKSLFLLGRWVCQLQQCLKLLLERIQIFQPKGAVKKNLFFVPKVKENLQNVEDFCRKIVFFLNCSAPDYGSNQNKKKEEGENGFEEDCFWNRFCEIAANYFRLRLYKSRVVFKEGGDDADSDPFKQDDDTVKFIRSQYRQMFPKRKRGKRGRSIECLALSVPSTDWFRGGGGSSSISVFKLLDIFMSLLIEKSVTHEVDSFEIEDLGSGAGRLERYTKTNVGEGRRNSSGNSSNRLQLAAAAAEEGSALDLDSDSKESKAEEEKDAADFWTELAASLLANSIEIDRKVLRSQLQIAAEAAATATASASFFLSSSYDARHPQQNNLETGVDVD